MTSRERNLRLIRNFLILPILLLLGAFLWWLANLFYGIYPSNAAEGSAWGSIGDSMSLAVIAGFMLVIIMIIWTMIMVSEMLHYKSDRTFIWVSIAILTIPYGPIAGYIGFKGANQIKWYFQREKITTNIPKYQSIALPDSCFIREFENKNDSLLFYLTSNKRQFQQGKRIPISFKQSPMQVSAWTNNLDVYMLSDQKLEKIPQPTLEFDALSIPNRYILQNRYSPRSLWHSSGDHHYILVGDTGNNEHLDTLWGYQEDGRNSHLQGQVSYIDEKGIAWFTFFTESVRDAPTYLFICAFSSNSKVFKIKLEKEDREWFDTGRIIGMFKKGKTLYIVSIKKIIYFDVE